MSDSDDATATDADARLTRRGVGAAAAVAAVLSLALGSQVLPWLSGNADEAVYLQQSEAIASGALTLDADLHDGPFRPWLTGTHDGRVFTQYQPGWPAVVALGDRAGSVRLAPALAAAALVVAAAALAHQIYGRHAVTRTVAAATLLTPLFVVHSFTFLAYSFSAAWLLGASAVAIAAVRRGDRRRAAAAGFLIGLGLMIRPFDAVLVGALWLLALGVIRGREALGVARRLGPAFVVGGLGPGLLTLAVNARVTGEPWRFPLSASADENRFGFGSRQILPGEPAIDYSFDVALDALGDNLSAVVGWLPLGIVGVILVVVGLWDTDMVTIRMRGVLIVALVAFPVGYLFWWATALSAAGARNGLGPHYYVPGVAFTVVLIGAGLVSLWDRLEPARRPLVMGVVILVGVGATAHASVDKLDDQQVTRDLQRASAETPLPAAPALVLLSHERPYLLVENGVLRNEPDRRNGVVFAVDDGAANLVARAAVDSPPHRLRQVWYPDDQLFEPTVEYAPLRYVNSRSICVRQLPASGSFSQAPPGGPWQPLSGGLALDAEAISVRFVPDDPTGEPARVTLRAVRAADGAWHAELPDTIERRVTLGDRDVWLASPNDGRLPIELVPGPCESTVGS